MDQRLARRIREGQRSSVRERVDKGTDPASSPLIRINRTFPAAVPSRSERSTSKLTNSRLTPSTTRLGSAPVRVGGSRLLLGDQTELLEYGHPVIETHFLGDQAVLDLEPHRLAGADGQRADRHVIECHAGVGAAADPLADDIVALGDQLGGATEGQVGERRPELRGEGTDLVAATARRGDLYRYEPVMVRAGQSTTRLIVSADAVNANNELPTVYAMHVVDSDPCSLLAVRVGELGWAFALEIDRPPRRRLVEHLGRATPEELEQVDNAIRAVFEV